MKKPEADLIYDEDGIDDVLEELVEIFASTIFKIILIVVCITIAISLAAFVWHIPIKDVIEGVISTCFIGVVIYGLSLIVNPDPKIISRKK